MTNLEERDFSMDEAPCHYSGEESFAWVNGASHGYTLGFRAALAATPAPEPQVCQTCRAFSMLTAK